MRLSNYRLKKLWRSPNATIRHALDGALFSHPILFKHIPKTVKHWRDPIIVARHSYGDQYDSIDWRVHHPGTLKLTFQPQDPEIGSWSSELHTFKCSGVFMGMYNTDESIRNFAHICFDTALNNSMDLRLATK